MRRGATVKSDALRMVPAKDRRALLEAERRRRSTGKWGEWERIENPHLLAPGWLGDVDHVRRNRVFSVLVRPLDCAVHLAVTSLSGVRPTWWEMQRIKNEIAGPGATAVEVYPPQDEVVDDADMFHIWVINALPFSLARSP